MNTEKEMKQAIYICGKVSGTADYIERFARVEKELNASFSGTVVNPVRECIKEFEKPEKFPWHILMMFVINEKLLHCTHIYLMHDWQDSYGARIEQLWGERLGLIEIMKIDATNCITIPTNQL
jgi:hypothetical protein